MTSSVYLVNRRDTGRRLTQCGPVNRQRLLQIAEDANVIDDQAILLVSPHSVCPCDGLHERVVLHRFVQVDRGARRHVEAGDPHGAYEHDAERIIGILELRFQVFLDHALAVRGDVQALLLELFDLVLFGGNHNRHVCFLKILQALFEFRLVHRIGGGKFLSAAWQWRSSSASERYRTSELPWPYQSK